MRYNMMLFLTVLFLLLSGTVSAYYGYNLISYYSFSDGNISSMLDSASSQNLQRIGSTGTYATTDNCIKDSCIYWNNSATVTRYNGTIDNVFNSAYTINFWIFQNSTPTNSQVYFEQSDTPTFTTYYTLTPFTSTNMTLKSNLGNIVLANKTIPTINAWSMVTIVNDLEYTYYYLNGVLMQTVNATVPYSNGKYVHIGHNPLNKMDEMSFWNKALTSDEILTLYNSGTGLDYNDTILASQSSSPQCIDDSSYCTSPVLIGDEIHCAFANTQYCGAGCIDNVCYNNVASDCSVIGSRKCISTTMYAVCSDSDGDTALDYGATYGCAVGEFCRESFNYADCTTSNTSGVHGKFGLNVIPYSVSTVDTTYVVDNQNKLVTVTTTFPFHNQKFYQSGTYYITRSCNYKETPIYYVTQPQEITTETQIYFTQSIAQDSIVRLSIIPSSFDNGTIKLLDVLDNSKSTIRFARNATDKSLCLYYNNGSILYCDYDTSLGDTFQKLDIEYTFSHTSSVYTMKFDIVRAYTNTIITYPIGYTPSDLTSMKIDAQNTTLSLTALYTVPQFDSFTSAVNNTIEAKTCIYESTGQYKVRTYGNNNGEPDYSVYFDYNVNVNGLALTKEQVKNAKDTGEIPENTKYLLSFLLIIGCSVLFAIPTFIATKSMSNGGAITGMVAIAGMALGLFFSMLFGWLYWIWVIILLIIDVAIIVGIFKSMFFSTEG